MARNVLWTTRDADLGGRAGPSERRDYQVELVRQDDQAELHFAQQWAVADGRLPAFDAKLTQMRELERQASAIAAELAILRPEVVDLRTEASKFAAMLDKVPPVERAERVARAREALAYVLREGFVRPADHEAASRLHLVSTALDRALCCRANLLVVDLNPYADPTCVVDIRRPDELRRAILRRPNLQCAPGGGVQIDHLDAFGEAVAIRDLYNNSLACSWIVAVSYESVQAVVRAALPCVVLPPETRVTPEGIRAGGRLYPEKLRELALEHPNKASLVRWLGRFIRTPGGDPVLTAGCLRPYLADKFALCMERRRALQEHVPQLEQAFWSWPRTLDEPWVGFGDEAPDEVLLEGERSTKRAPPEREGERAPKRGRCCAAIL